MTALYNEHDHGAAAWLRELINQRQITEGTVDERSIADLQPEDVSGFRRVHLFAGIGGWELALRIAGWPEDIPVWTGSCPCQPFSAAGKRKGQADERHLWPEMFRLIQSVRPPCVMGEQVPGAIKPGWLDGVFADLEGAGYTCGAVVLGAHSAGAPHIRQRIYWVAKSNGKYKSSQREGEAQSPNVGTAPRRDESRIGGCGAHGGLAHTERSGGRINESIGGPERRAADRRDCAECDHGLVNFDSPGSQSGNAATETDRHGSSTVSASRNGSRLEHAESDGRGERRPEPVGGSVAGGCCDEWVGDTESTRSQGRPDECDSPERQREAAGRSTRFSSGAYNPWSDYRLIHFRDGKTRRIESSIEPLVDGLPGRVGLLRGYGNAIVPQTAAAFIRAVMEELQIGNSVSPPVAAAITRAIAGVA